MHFEGWCGGRNRVRWKGHTKRPAAHLEILEFCRLIFTELVAGRIQSHPVQPVCTPVPEVRIEHALSRWLVVGWEFSADVYHHVMVHVHFRVAGLALPTGRALGTGSRTKTLDDHAFDFAGTRCHSAKKRFSMTVVALEVMLILVNCRPRLAQS